MRQTRWALAAALVCCEALATTVVEESVEQMTQSAPRVVRGVVGQVRSQWDESRRRIDTYVEVLVSASLKGPAVRSLLVRRPGGVVEGVGMRVDGAPSFTTGEEVVLFLEPAADDRSVYNLWSLAAGKVSLVRSPSGITLARRDLRGLAFYAQGDRARVWAIDGDELGTAEQFLARVRAALAGAPR